MAKTSGIEWTDATWNPWRGCHKVSPGCDNCYMFRDQARYGRDPSVVVRSKTTFEDPLKWADPRMVFTCSWSDWFHKDADDWREAAWDIIRTTPQHTYQILTKRPSLIERRLPADWGDQGYPNVWLGISAENQETFDQRWPVLRNIPAAIRWLSLEPLLGPILIGEAILHRLSENRPSAQWVVVGGESGPKYRHMDPNWAVEIVEQCRATDVPVFVEQLGGWPDKRGDLSLFPRRLQVREFPAVADVPRGT